MYLSFQVTLQQGCNKILMSDCYTLLQRQFRNLSRGHSIKEETKCGGCRGHIVSPEATSHCDTFVFNCKHAFHEDCLADDGGGVSEDGKLTSTITCPLCNPNRKWSQWYLHIYLFWSINIFWKLLTFETLTLTNYFCIFGMANSTDLHLCFTYEY